MYKALFILLVLVTWTLNILAKSSLACSSVGPQNCNFTSIYANNHNTTCGWMLKGGLVIEDPTEHKNSKDYVIRLRNNETKGRLESIETCSASHAVHCLSVRHRVDDAIGDANLTFYLQQGEQEEQILKTVSPGSLWNRTRVQYRTSSNFIISIEASRSRNVTGEKVYIDEVWYIPSPCQPTSTDDESSPTVRELSTTVSKASSTDYEVPPTVYEGSTTVQPTSTIHENSPTVHGSNTIHKALTTVTVAEHGPGGSEASQSASCVAVAVVTAAAALLLTLGGAAFLMRFGVFNSVDLA